MFQDPQWLRIDHRRHETGTKDVAAIERSRDPGGRFCRTGGLVQKRMESPRYGHESHGVWGKSPWKWVFFRNNPNNTQVELYQTPGWWDFVPRLIDMCPVFWGQDRGSCTFATTLRPHNSCSFIQPRHAPSKWLNDHYLGWHPEASHVFGEPSPSGRKAQSLVPMRWDTSGKWMP